MVDDSDLLAPVRERIERLERENAELRAEVRRLAMANNDLCDELFEARERLTAANGADHG